MITAQAYAKINITFEVLGRRKDGYHDVASVIQEIDLKDDLKFELAPSLSIECDDAALRSSDNLVLKAARLLQQETAYKGGVKIILRKGIPVAAGLGGGSADAAATLIALNKLWKLKLSTESLVELAAALGSDVPYFIHGGTALAEGRGEKVTPLSSLPKSWVVLLNPSVPIPEPKTKAMYGALISSHYSDGEVTKRVVSAIEHGVKRASFVAQPESYQSPCTGTARRAPTSPMGGGIKRKRPAPLFQMYNAFDAVAFEMYEGMEWYWKQFLSAGAPEVHLAGAGPTLFTLLSGRKQAEGIYRSLSDLGLETYIVQTVKRA
jgi:4-diphosphocytidyl-2-C-methyl-D-erythritol kinase